MKTSVKTLKTGIFIMNLRPNKYLGALATPQNFKIMLQDNIENNEINWGKKNELIFIALAIIIAGFIAKIPQFQGVREDLFYEKNISFIFLPFLSISSNLESVVSFLTFLALIPPINAVPKPIAVPIPAPAAIIIYFVLTSLLLLNANLLYFVVISLIVLS